MEISEQTESQISESITVYIILLENFQTAFLKILLFFNTRMPSAVICSLRCIYF